MSTITSVENARPIRRLEDVKPLKIGDLVIDPPIFQAPMAGYTNYAFREIVRSYGGVGFRRQK